MWAVRHLQLFMVQRSEELSPLSDEPAALRGSISDEHKSRLARPKLLPDCVHFSCCLGVASASACCSIKRSVYNPLHIYMPFSIYIMEKDVCRGTGYLCYHTFCYSAIPTSCYICVYITCTILTVRAKAFLFTGIFIMYS